MPPRFSSLPSGVFLSCTFLSAFSRGFFSLFFFWGSCVGAFLGGSSNKTWSAPPKKAPRKGPSKGQSKGSSKNLKKAPLKGKKAVQNSPARPRSRPLPRPSRASKARKAAEKKGATEPLPPPHPEEAQLVRGSKHPVGRCWQLYRLAQEDGQRHRRLLPRRKVYPCEIQAWKDCKTGQGSPEGCRNEAVRSRWYACYRIYRRLFVITQRLVDLEKQGREASCSWKLVLPEERFVSLVFEPPPPKKR